MAFYIIKMTRLKKKQNKKNHPKTKQNKKTRNNNNKATTTPHTTSTHTKTNKQTNAAKDPKPLTQAVPGHGYPKTVTTGQTHGLSNPHVTFQSFLL